MNTESSYLSALGSSKKRQVEHDHVYFPFLINNNYIIKMNALIQKTLELYKQMEREVSQGTELLRAALILGWNFCT